MTERYNGWTNHETWLVNLWLDNEQGTKDFINEEIENLSLPEAAERIEEIVTDGATETVGTTGMYSDLLLAALRKVDWNETAEHFKED